MLISHTSCIFRQKQHINGQNPAKQAFKICPKNFPGVTE